MKYLIFVVLFLGGCASKPKLMRDCVKTDISNISICKEF